MKEQTIKIAFYGKGGIGKSTVASNISAALAASGKRVLHIGCDPKADSTRCLTERKIPDVLSQINCLGESIGREDIVFPGAFGVSCIESGGPRAGVGCAGMGITSMEEELKRLKILDEDWDVIIYDVLGDVVCGGFAVPMRKHYVQKVYVVTSSDGMSIYAANNILKGIQVCCTEEEKLFGGLILNHCRSSLDQEIAGAFSTQTGAPVLFSVEESREIRLADYQRATVLQVFPYSRAARDFRALSELVVGGGCGVTPRPMTDEELDDFCRDIFLKRRDQL